MGTILITRKCNRGLSEEVLGCRLLRDSRRTRRSNIQQTDGEEVGDDARARSAHKSGHSGTKSGEGGNEMNVLVEAADRERRNAYKELMKRQERRRELAIVADKLQLQKQLAMSSGELKPRRVKKGTNRHSALYKWHYERRR